MLCTRKTDYLLNYLFSIICVFTFVEKLFIKSDKLKMQIFVVKVIQLSTGYNYYYNFFKLILIMFQVTLKPIKQSTAFVLILSYHL